MFTSILKRYASVLLFILPLAAQADNLINHKENDWVAKSFVFEDGAELKDLRIHYHTLGNKENPPVLLLHGTNQPVSALLSKNFAGELFGPVQALDLNKYFIIIPESIGSGKSSKPSDGLGIAFPKYNYNDMVNGQYRLLKEGLGIDHLYLVMGYSMGGMQTWLWGEKHPDMMDNLVPMASQPNELSGRNWMLRRMLIESIKQDPAWNNGDYKEQPPAAKIASNMFSIATTGGTLALQDKAPTRVAADELVNTRLATDFNSDANDLIYIWGASKDYNALPELHKIKARVLVINSSDDERNPPDISFSKGELERLQNAELFIIPGSTTTSGHGTAMQAKYYNERLKSFLK